MVEKNKAGNDPTWSRIQKNQKQLRLLHIVVRCFYLIYLLLAICCFSKILLMGYYNTIGLISIICMDTLFCIMKIQLFLILATVSLHLKLKTHVHSNGKMFLIAFDPYDREVMKIILKQTQGQDGYFQTQMIEEFHLSNPDSSQRSRDAFVVLDQHSSRDDFTSDGVASRILVQPSPNNSRPQSGYLPLNQLSPGSYNDFVSQYREAGNTRKEQTAIFSPKHDQSLNTQSDALDESGKSDEVVLGLGVS